MPRDVEDAPFCIPTHGVFKRGCSWEGQRAAWEDAHQAGCGTCYDGECEGLHLRPEDARQQATWPAPPGPLLVVTAGPERSGSTWLFNAVRLLLRAARQPTDPYWLSQVTTAKLEQRSAGQAGGHHVLVKTHAWSAGWDPAAASRIYLMHRDLRAVQRSYRRMGWRYTLPDSYVADHERWRAVAHLDLAFEEVMADPLAQLACLADDLSIAGQVDLAAVLAEVNALQPPAQGPPDPVSKLWPRHLGPQVMKQTASPSAPVTAPPGETDSVADAQLLKRFPEYFRQYGYA